MKQLKSIGFIGLGTMGAPMSANLIRKSKLPIMVYDVNKERVGECVRLGASAASSATEIVSYSSIIFTMLPKNEHVLEVLGEMLPLAAPGQLFVEMSTISPNLSIQLAGEVLKKGAAMIDAPVVKSRAAAVEGKLGIYVGGPPDAYKRALPLLSCMGENILHLGRNGAGLTMKLCHNMLVCQIQNGVNEALALAKKSGDINVLAFAKAVACGGAKNFYLESKKEALQKEDFTPAFAIEYMNKDIHLAKELSREAGLALPGMEVSVRRYEQAMEDGLGSQDFSATYRLLEV